MYNKNRETLEAYVLGDDFKYFQNLKYLPLSTYPSNIQSALVIYCFSGKARLNVYDDSHWIQPQELIILLPGQFVSFTEASDDFLTTTLVVSPTMFSDTLSGVPRFINGKTNCSTFTKHFVPNLILLTQNKMCILLRWFHLFTSFVYLCISLA